MRLVLLGTGGYFPTKRRHTACLMLPEVGVILDAGTGMCQVGRHRQTDRLDIFLSHAHLDHIVGLTCLINVVSPSVLAQTVIHGDAAKLAAVRQHLFADELFPVPPPFRFEPFSNPCRLPQGGTLTSFPLTHPGGALGFRLEWPGHSLAYVTDTTASVEAPYVDAIRGVDLLLHEAYFADNDQNLPAATGHSSLVSLAELVAETQPGRLVLLHFNPLIDSDSPFDRSQIQNLLPHAILAEDDAEFEF